MGDINHTARLAVEMWKLLAAFERAVLDLPQAKIPRVAAQLRFTRSRLDSVLEEAGLRLLTFDGQAFSANLPASPINAEDLDETDSATIASTIEPAVVADGRILINAKVFLAGA